MSDPCYWEPPPIWRGEIVFVVGGGPSLFGFNFDRLRGRRVIAINTGVNDLPFADLLYFRDEHWLRRERETIEKFRGLIVTPSLACIRLVERAQLLQVNTAAIPRARTSGQQCVSLALLMGARRVVLLGFDWNREGGHYHRRYPEAELPYTGALLEYGWDGYAARAARLGAMIVNATPGSAIKQFARVRIEDELAASVPADQAQHRHAVSEFSQGARAGGL